MPIIVPPAFRPAIDTIGNLQEEQWESLIRTITATPTANVAILLAGAATGIGGDPDDTARLVTLLINSMLEYEKEEESADDVAASIAEQAPKWQTGDARWRELVVHRLKQVFEADQTFGVSAKASTVLSDSPNGFCDVRVLTDIRPVFSRSLSPEAFAVLHSLRISAHAGDGTVSEHFFSLTPENLAKLKAALDRAQDKETALRQSVELRWVG